MKDTVTISLEMYEELKEVFDKRNEPRKHTVYMPLDLHSVLKRCDTDNDAIAILVKELSTKTIAIEDLKNNINHTEFKYNNLHSEFENMSNREFRQWKRRQWKI